MSQVVTTQAPLHGQFTLTRTIAAPPSAVFAALAEPDLRRRWFRLPGPRAGSTHEIDVRDAGTESLHGTFAPLGVAETLENVGTFLDVVPDRRLVRATQVRVDGTRRWVSLATTTLAPDPDGTLVTHTEQYTFLAYDGDGSDDVSHLAGGTRLQLNGLASVADSVGALARD